jgi:hypothetical protein
VSTRDVNHEKALRIDDATLRAHHRRAPMRDASRIGARAGRIAYAQHRINVD